MLGTLQATPHKGFSLIVSIYGMDCYMVWTVICLLSIDMPSGRCEHQKNTEKPKTPKKTKTLKKKDRKYK